jgi:hypothetical protein
MKKITFSVLIFVSLLIANTSQATPGCYQSGNTAGCTVTASSFSVAWAIDDFWVTPTGLDLHVYFAASIPSEEEGYLAYGTANWASNSGRPFHHYGTGPYSGTIPYYSEAYGWLFEGWLNLTAIAYGPGSSAGVWADW